jgi:hypothetical protein
MSCTAIAKDTWPSRSFSVFCGTLNTGPKPGDSCTTGKVFGRHGLQRELALAALEDELVLAGLQHHGLVGRHGAQDVDQLAGAHRGREVAVVAVELGGGADLDLQVTGGELQDTMPVLRISTLARIGKVCRRSTMPATDCRTDSTFWPALFSSRSCQPLL